MAGALGGGRRSALKPAAESLPAGLAGCRRLLGGRRRAVPGASAVAGGALRRVPGADGHGPVPPRGGGRLARFGIALPTSGNGSGAAGLAGGDALAAAPCCRA